MHPWEHSRAARLAGPLGLGALTLAGVGALSCFGLPAGTPAYLGPVSLGTAALSSGLIALAYLLGAFGLGRPLAAWLAKDSAHRLWIQLGLGLGVLLWVSHALGLCGLLSGPGPGPRIAGWAAVGLGIVLLSDQIVRGPLRPERWPIVPLPVILFAPALAVLIVAASNPPLLLWHGTEHGAFDALEYHLQLPKEWATGDRIWPLSHNVYSFLPSFVEAAYMHLGAMMPGGTGSPAGGNDPLARMVGGLNGDGNWFIACQYLHTGMAIIAALLIARAAWAIASRCGTEPRAAVWLGIIAGAFVLCTPWVIVVSSLPYNEAGLLALAAAGALVAIDDTCKPWGRGASAGWAVGIACGCKPTALFLVGPFVGFLLLWGTPWRTWARVVTAGALAGGMAVWPWLLRNYLVARNPVFPFATSIFHNDWWWTDQQVANFAAHHHAPPDLGIGDRFARLASDDFGLRHEQWGVFAIVLITAAVGALAWSRSHRLAAALVAGLLAQILCWMTLTHLQSRFLLPLVIPGALLLAAAGAAMLSWVGRPSPNRRAMTIGAIAVLAAVPLAQALGSVLLFLKQRDFHPNQLLVVGPGGLTGLGADAEFVASSPEAQDAFLANAGPIAYVNLRIRPNETPNSGVYLLGDSTPAYYMARAWSADPSATHLPGSVIAYHTTWDATPILGSDGNRDPSHWSRQLHEANIRYLMVNYEELHRLIDMDHTYDPAMTFDKITTWIDDPRSRLRPLRAWRDSAQAHTGTELFLVDIPFPESGGRP